MKNLIKGIFTIFFSFLLVAVVVSSCEEENEEPDICTGCTANEPWSKPGLGVCYASQQDCEAAQGPTCEICN